MAATRAEHQKFWRTFAERLKEHGSIVRALNESKPEMAGTAFEEALARIATAVESGTALNRAASWHARLFSQTAVLLLRAGEEGGYMAPVVERAAEAARDGSLPLPDVPPQGEEQVRYWRCFGRMLSCGVPILESFRALREEACGRALAEATRAIEQSILRGSSIGNAMREHPDLFPRAVCFAVDLSEEQGNVDEQAAHIADALESGDLGSLRAEPIEHLSRMDELPAVRRFVNVLILAALRERASDIHVEPTENKRGRFRIRVDGVLHDFEWPDEEFKRPTELPYDEIVNRIKVMAGMDLAEKRLPQDGRIQLNVSGEPIDLRVSTLPTVHGERVTMRVLVREAARVDLDQIGLLEDDLEKVRRLVRLPHGVLLMAGPAGSGKTTLLYAMLRMVDRDRCSVVSVEDPVEYSIEGVSQVNVNPHVGRTFARSVRALLRQDPDVILIGEIRDLEVADLATLCAMTGHLVLTTLNAPTAPIGVRRLLDIGLEPFVVNSSVVGVISQRLVRMLCPDCKQPVEPPLHSVPPEAVELIQGRGDVQFYGPVGCEKCNRAGYRGRTAIHEVLIPDDRVKELVAAEASADGIRDAALAAGMRTMLACGIEKAARGITSIQEVIRVV